MNESRPIDRQNARALLTEDCTESWEAATLQGEEMAWVAKSVEIMPLEAAQIGLPRPRAMQVQHFEHPRNISFLPGVLGQVHVGGVKSSLKLLLLGGEPVGEGFDLVALLLGLVTLLLG